MLTSIKCTPREKLWNPRIPGHCISTHQLGVASGTVNVISDFSIFILPLPIIRRLQMSTEKKVRVYGCFCFGLVACISSIVRVAYSIKLLHIPNSSPDYLITIDVTGLWRYEKTSLLNLSMNLTRHSFGEMSIGIIVGCLPSLPRFFKQLFQTKTIPSSTTKVGPGNGSGWIYWRRLLHKSTTAYTDSDQVRVSPRNILGSKSSRSTAPYLPTLNFSNTFIQVAEEDFPMEPLPKNSKRVSTTHSHLWQAPASWLSSVKRGGNPRPRDSTNTERTLC